MPDGRPAISEIAAGIAARLGTGNLDEDALSAASVTVIEEEHTNRLWLAESDQGPIVVKGFVGQQADGADREWRFLNLFADAFPGRSPTPLLFEPDCSLIVMDRVPGKPIGDAVLTDDQVDSIADWLTVAHAAPPRPDGLPRARTAPGALVPRTQLVWSIARETRTGDPTVDEAMEAAAAWMDSGELERLLALTTDVVSRGDTNLANCLWDGSTVRMVDFEDAGWNSRVVELGDYIEHIRARRNSAAVWDHLVHRVGLTTEERAALRTVRRRFALWWLVMLLPGGRAAHRNPPEALPEQAERLLTLLDSDV